MKRDLNYFYAIIRRLQLYKYKIKRNHTRTSHTNNSFFFNTHSDVLQYSIIHRKNVKRLSQISLCMKGMKRLISLVPAQTDFRQSHDSRIIFKLDCTDYRGLFHRGYTEIYPWFISSAYIKLLDVLGLLCFLFFSGSLRFKEKIAWNRFSMRFYVTESQQLFI